MIRRSSTGASTKGASRVTARAAASKSVATSALATSSMRHVWPLVLVAVIVAFVLCYATFLRSQRLGTAGPDGIAVPGGVSALVQKVSRHVSVKADEQPTVATVEDAELLRQQRPAFYQEAENGDKLLIWSDKAVLYSVRKDVVLAVLPIEYVAGNGAAASSTTATTSGETTAVTEVQAPTVEVRNGTARAGLARRATDLLKAAGFTTNPPGDAKDRAYTKTLYLVKEGGAFPVSEPNIASLMKAEKAEALIGERPTTADILIILGADYQP